SRSFSAGREVRQTHGRGAGGFLSAAVPPGRCFSRLPRPLVALSRTYAPVGRPGILDRAGCRGTPGPCPLPSGADAAGVSIGLVRSAWSVVRSRELRTTDFLNEE